MSRRSNAFSHRNGLMKIHSTAIIHPDAQIDATVQIGPYTVIDDGVEIGPDCIIANGARIYRGTRLGSKNRIDSNVVLGSAPQDLSFDLSGETGLVIGEGNQIREGVNISRATKSGSPTRIGSGNYLMGNFHVGHDCVIGDKNIFTHGSVLAGHVTVGSGVVISGLVAVHQFCRIGDLAMLSGCARINKDVPPYTTAEGNPATLVGLNTVGLKRAGHDLKSRLSIKRAYEALFRGGVLLSDALKELSSAGMTPAVAAIFAFFNASRRGITRHRREGAEWGDAE
jgi:UDP-N-acetylglucosamine acyltransferase